MKSYIRIKKILKLGYELDDWHIDLAMQAIPATADFMRAEHEFYNRNKTYDNHYRDMNIFIEYFGFNDGISKSAYTVSKKYAITGSRVTQIVAKKCRQLRRILDKKQIMGERK